MPHGLEFVSTISDKPVVRISQVELGTKINVIMFLGQTVQIAMSE